MPCAGHRAILVLWVHPRRWPRLGATSYLHKHQNRPLRSPLGTTGEASLSEGEHVSVRWPPSVVERRRPGRESHLDAARPCRQPWPAEPGGDLGARAADPRDEVPPVTGSDGRVPVVIGLAANKSLKENRPVKLGEIG